MQTARATRAPIVVPLLGPIVAVDTSCVAGMPGIRFVADEDRPFAALAALIEKPRGGSDEGCHYRHRYAEARFPDPE